MPEHQHVSFHMSSIRRCVIVALLLIAEERAVAEDVKVNGAASILRPRVPRRTVSLSFVWFHPGACKNGASRRSPGTTSRSHLRSAQSCLSSNVREGKSALIRFLVGTPQYCCCR